MIAFNDLITAARVCCGDTDISDCEECSNHCKVWRTPTDSRSGENRFCRQWFMHDVANVLESFADNDFDKFDTICLIQQMRAELETAVFYICDECPVTKEGKDCFNGCKWRSMRGKYLTKGKKAIE